MLSPEAPYPLHGGGAYRTASLLNYFARFADVDLLLISDSGKPACIPPGLVRSQFVIPLPRHRRDMLSRYMRNAMRALRGVPPLIDRLSGLGASISSKIAGRVYDLGIVDHFWCAPYLPEMSGVCSRVILNLHNIESILHQRSASSGVWLSRLAHSRFARASRPLESKLFGRFDAVLTPSDRDSSEVRAITPEARAITYPNALPWQEIPCPRPQRVVAFSGNFEYHPNIEGLRFFVGEIWPLVRRARPEVILRLVGRGERHIRHLIKNDDRIQTTGQIGDALGEIASAEVVVAPLLAGSGTRIKILEAWAAARPVVATAIAAEGLAAVHNENCRLADNPKEFADAVIQLLDSQSERSRIGMRARRTFENFYTWQAVWNGLDISLQVLRSE